MNQKPICNTRLPWCNMWTNMYPKIILAVGVAFYLSGCSPTVKVEPPEKPIEINLNVKIDHEIRVKVEKDIDELLSENEELF